MASISKKAAIARSYAPFRECNMFRRAELMDVRGRESAKRIFTHGTVLLQASKRRRAIVLEEDAPIERERDARGATVYFWGRLRVIRRGGGKSRMFYVVLESSINRF